MIAPPIYSIREGSWLTPDGRPITFRFREGTNDWNTINSCLGSNDEYGLRGLTFAGPVVDVGGYLGSVGIAIAVDHPGADVTIIEPVPDNADLIRQNAALNGVQVTVLEGAVGRGGEAVDVWYGYRGTELAEHHAFVGNSSLAYDHGGQLDHESVTYTALGIDELGEIDFLKIDCEGGEWAFLDADLSHVRRIVGEAHAVRGHRGKDIVDLLAATHDVVLSGDTEGTCEFRAVLRA